MSLRPKCRLWITIAVLVAAAMLPAAAQYPGEITNPNKNMPTLRAVGVLEWTGDDAKPKTSRLVPVCIYDGQDLEDAGVYMARPEPIALESETEYQLMLDGKPVGLFDVDSAGEQQGSWVGLGNFKALPVPKPAPRQIAKVDEYDAQSDEPVLHRAGDATRGPSGDSGSDSSQTKSEPPPDPDRPTLHKSGDASASGSGDSGSSTSAGSSTSSSGSTQSSSSGGPTLHKGGDASSNGSGGRSGDSGSNSSAPDPDRPTLHRSDDTSSAGNASQGSSGTPTLKRKTPEEEGSVSDVATTDPNRPHLFYGKSAGYGAPVLPSLIGLPPDMHQEVAVSDKTNRPIHPWDYSWANPDDEAKMKAGMEDLARTALGLNPPPAPAPKKTMSKTARKSAKPAPPPAPAPLLDEQFRVFELAYGSGATMVLSAHTAGASAPMKFVTLIAQPDLYGGIAVLLKNVTDAAHLDDTPRMKLIDAVDALADNRGELLFELRGATQRQFALYRVLRGDASRIFLSGADAIGSPVGQ